MTNPNDEARRLAGALDRRQFLATTGGSLALLALPPWLSACGAQQAGLPPALVGALVPNIQPTPDYFEKQFGVTPELIRKVMGAALSRGGDFADLYFQHSFGMSLGLEDDVVNRASSSIDLGAGIRVVVGDQTGYAFTEDLSEASMIAAAKTAATIAATKAGVAPQDLTPHKLPRYYDTNLVWQGVGVDSVIPMIDDLNKRAHAAHSSVERVNIGFGAGQTVMLVVDSEGRSSFDSQPMTRLNLSVVMNKNGERQSNGYHVAGREGLGFYDGARLGRIVKEAIARTDILFDAGKPPAGEMPVVLAAGSSGILLHEAIGHGMEADFNRKGVSIFSDRIGKKVAEPFVTIVDDGTNPSLRGSINVDDEGYDTERTALVENGILKSYLHDRISAKHFGVKPTGSGRRESFRHMPLPRMRNTYMENGPHTKEEIFRNVKKGIYCVSFTNGQVNIGAGDYSFYVKNGWLIEDGKLTQPIKDINIIGNGPESLSRVTMVANDFEMDEGGWTCGKDGQSVPVSLGLPTILVSSIVVGGSNA